MGSVGCGRHSAQIIDRDGALVAAVDVLLEVEWGRVLDGVSLAKVLVQPGGDCCEALRRVKSWRHKLMVWRGLRVWEGPVIDVVWKPDGVEIHALDVLAWMDRRVPHTDKRFTGTELALIAEWLVEDAFAPHDPGHRVEIIAPTGIRGSREYERDVGQTWEHLRNLAQTGVDFTAVGSRILILPEWHNERVGVLTDADFPNGVRVVEDGAGLVTRWVVHGDDEVKGEAGGIDPYYGLLERSVEETSILDDLSAAAAARSKLRGSVPAPIFLDTQEATLSPDAAVDVSALVPGWCVDVVSTSTCRNITQTLKIYGVEVTEDASGETVRVQLAAPTGVRG